MGCVLDSRFSCVQLFATLWAVALQAHLSISSPGKNTGVGGRAFLQGIFQTQGSNLRLLCLFLKWDDILSYQNIKTELCLPNMVPSLRKFN